MTIQFVKDNLLLFAIAFISGAMLLWPLIRRGTGGPWATTLEATQMINRQDAPVIDVREEAEFAKGHIVGARHMPLAQLEARAKELHKYKSKPVIVCCETGNRSSSAMATLKKLGFENVYNLSGGYAGWQQAGLPVEK